MAVQVTGGLSLPSNQQQDSGGGGGGGGTPVELEINPGDWVNAAVSIVGDAISGGTLDGWPWINALVGGNGITAIAEVENVGLQWTFDRTGYNAAQVGSATAIVPRLEYPQELVGDFEIVFGLTAAAVSGYSNAWFVGAGQYETGDEHHAGHEVDAAISQIIGNVRGSTFGASSNPSAPAGTDPTILYIRCKRTGATIEAAWSTDNATWNAVTDDFDLAGSQVIASLQGWFNSGLVNPVSGTLVYVYVKGTVPAP